MPKFDTLFFRDNMRYLREGKRYTQSLIEKKYGIPQSQLSEFEKGSKRPYLDQAIIISEVAHESLDDMIYLNMEERDANWKAEGQKRISIRRRPAFVPVDNELIGRQPLVNERLLKRFSNITYYVYYISGIKKRKLQVGKLQLKPKRPNSSLILGNLRTNSQEYDCKLVIEHPLYIYLFGNNKDNTERLTLMLHEPKSRYDSKPYKGGLGIVMMEGSNGIPSFQRMGISKCALPQDERLIEFLQLHVTNGYRCEVTRKEDSAFYYFIQDCDNREQTD